MTCFSKMLRLTLPRPAPRRAGAGGEAGQGRISPVGSPLRLRSGSRRQNGSRSFDFAQDFACRLPLGQGLAHAAKTAQDPSTSLRISPVGSRSANASLTPPRRLKILRLRSGFRLSAPARLRPRSRRQDGSNCQRPLRKTASARPGAMTRISRRPGKRVKSNF
jgi:hypothetical protein